MRIMYTLVVALAFTCLCAMQAYAQASENAQLKFNTMNEGERNKQSILNFYATMLNERQTNLIDSLVSPKYRNAAGAGPEVVKQGALQLLSAFPDIHWEIEDILADENKVMVRQRTTGTHDGVLQGHAPSGNKFTTEGFAIYYFSQGKIISHQVITDRYGFLQQIGVIK